MTVSTQHGLVQTSKLEGKKAAAYLKAYAEKKGMSAPKIVDIQGTIGASAQIGRTKGLEDAVKLRAGTFLRKQPVNLHRQKARKLWSPS